MTVKCNGKCYECEGVINGQIEDIEGCAIITTQRRTNDILQKINQLETILLTSIQENQQKKGRKSVPVKTEDNIVNFDEND